MIDGSFERSLQKQCSKQHEERKVIDAWINDASLEMEICDYCVHDCVFDERCIGFKYNGKEIYK